MFFGQALGYFGVMIGVGKGDGVDFDQFCAKQLHRIFFLLRLRARHDDDTAITQGIGDHG